MLLCAVGNYTLVILELAPILCSLGLLQGQTVAGLGEGTKPKGAGCWRWSQKAGPGQVLKGDLVHILPCSLHLAHVALEQNHRMMLKLLPTLMWQNTTAPKAEPGEQQGTGSLPVEDEPCPTSAGASPRRKDLHPWAVPQSLMQHHRNASCSSGSRKALWSRGRCRAGQPTLGSDCSRGRDSKSLAAQLQMSYFSADKIKARFILFVKGHPASTSYLAWKQSKCLCSSMS